MGRSCPDGCRGWTWCRRSDQTKNSSPPLGQFGGCGLAWRLKTVTWRPCFGRLGLLGQALPAPRRPLKTRTSCAAGPRALLWREEGYRFCLLLIPQLPKHWINYVCNPLFLYQSKSSLLTSFLPLGPFFIGTMLRSGLNYSTALCVPWFEATAFCFVIFW